MMQGAAPLVLAVLWRDVLLIHNAVSSLSTCTDQLKSCYLHRNRTNGGQWNVWHGDVFPVM